MSKAADDIVSGPILVSKGDEDKTRLRFCGTRRGNSDSSCTGADDTLLTCISAAIILISVAEPFSRSGSDTEYDVLQNFCPIAFVSEGASAFQETMSRVTEDMVSGPILVVKGATGGERFRLDCV